MPVNRAKRVFLFPCAGKTGQVAAFVRKSDAEVSRVHWSVPGSVRVWPQELLLAVVPEEPMGAGMLGM